MEKQESQGSVASAGQENWNQMEIPLSQEAERTAWEESEAAREEPAMTDNTRTAEPEAEKAAEPDSVAETGAREAPLENSGNPELWRPVSDAAEDLWPEPEGSRKEAGHSGPENGQTAPRDVREAEEERAQADRQTAEEPEAPRASGWWSEWFAGAREAAEMDEEPVIGPEEAFLRDLAAQVENEKTRDYIETRVIPQMEWCREKGAEYGARYQDCMRASIILGALIPVLAVFANGSRMVKVLIALFGVGITALNAYLTLYNFRDMELDFRGTGEALLRTLYCYFNNAGTFAQVRSQTEKDAILVDVCEDVLSP